MPNHCPRCQLTLVPGATRCVRCGADATPAENEILIDGRYRVERELGRGAMGVVYLARDTGLDRRVALKLISPAFASTVAFIERFRREAVGLAAIRDQHVVQIYAFGRVDDSCFFAMEYVEGTSLDDIIVAHRKNGTTVPANLALSILSDVASGVGAIHTAGLLHRDIKPLNVIIEARTGRAVVIDLGLTKTIEEVNAKHTEMVGSPPYMAPEQILTTRYAIGLSPRTDVYALACTAFELLTGRLPYSDEGSPFAIMSQHLNEPVPMVSTLRPELAAMDPILARGMAKDPAERYASARELAADIAMVLNGRRGRAHTFPATARPAPMTSPRSIRLMIVDDDAAMRSALARAAKHAFKDVVLEIVMAESGADALARTAEVPPDLVTLDVDMPGMDGVATLAALRATEGAAHVPALVVTGNPLDDVRWRFAALGVADFLEKPVSVEKIAPALRRALRLSID